MGLYFRKRIAKLPFGGRLTFGSGGFGLSFGGKSIRLHINSQGSYVNTHIPNTNLYIGKKVGQAGQNTNYDQSGNGSGCSSVNGCVWCIVVFLLIMFIGGSANIITALIKGKEVQDSDVICVCIFLVIVGLSALNARKVKKIK